MCCILMQRSEFYQHISVVSTLWQFRGGDSLLSDLWTNTLWTITNSNIICFNVHFLICEKILFEQVQTLTLFVSIFTFWFVNKYSYIICFNVHFLICEQILSEQQTSAYYLFQCSLTFYEMIQEYQEKVGHSIFYIISAESFSFQPKDVWANIFQAPVLII